MEMVLLLWSWLSVVVQLVLVVIFLMLLERKIISYMSVRKGPNKVTFGGLFQSIADILKLVLKETEPNNLSNKKFFFYGPFMSLVMIVLSWLKVNIIFFSFTFKFGMMVVFCLASFNIYMLLVVSWGGKSKYGLLGGLRASAQVMSYEISFFFIIFCPLIMYKDFSMMKKSLNYYLVGYFLVMLFGMWIFTCMAETNRAPFDFAEGESELVSGFNVEYGALQFGFLYVGEYGSIMLLSCLSMLMFFNLSPLVCFWLVKLMMFVYIWLRASLPRFRYDMLMNVAWTGILPNVLFILLFFLMLS